MINGDIKKSSIGNKYRDLNIIPILNSDVWNHRKRKHTVENICILEIQELYWLFHNVELVRDMTGALGSTGPLLSRHSHLKEGNDWA